LRPSGGIVTQFEDTKAVKTTMKKLLSGLLAFTVLASFSGCALANREPEQTTTAETTTSAPATFPSTQPPTETTTAVETTAPESTGPAASTDTLPPLSTLVPLPDFGIRITFSETGNEWTGNYTGVRFADYGDYISRLKKAGFDRNISSAKALNAYTFSADNGEGIEVSIAYARLLGTMTVTAER